MMMYRIYWCVNPDCDWFRMKYKVTPMDFEGTPFVAWPNLECCCGNEPARVWE